MVGQRYGWRVLCYCQDEDRIPSPGVWMQCRSRSSLSASVRRVGILLPIFSVPVAVEGLSGGSLNEILVQVRNAEKQQSLRG